MARQYLAGRAGRAPWAAGPSWCCPARSGPSWRWKTGPGSAGRRPGPGCSGTRPPAGASWTLGDTTDPNNPEKLPGRRRTPRPRPQRRPFPWTQTAAPGLPPHTGKPVLPSRAPKAAPRGARPVSARETWASKAPGGQSLPPAPVRWCGPCSEPAGAALRRTMSKNRSQQVKPIVVRCFI